MIRASSLLLVLLFQGCAMTTIRCQKGECSMTVQKLGRVKPIEWQAIKDAFEKAQEKKR